MLDTQVTTIDQVLQSCIGLNVGKKQSLDPDIIARFSFFDVKPLILTPDTIVDCSMNMSRAKLLVDEDGVVVSATLG